MWKRLQPWPWLLPWTIRLPPLGVKPEVTSRLGLHVSLNPGYRVTLQTKMAISIRRSEYLATVERVATCGNLRSHTWLWGAIYNR